MDTTLNSTFGAYMCEEDTRPVPPNYRDASCCEHCAQYRSINDYFGNCEQYDCTTFIAGLCDSFEMAEWVDKDNEQ